MYLADTERLLKIASEFGTPTYAYDLDKVKTQYQMLVNSIKYSDKSIYYAVKANHHPEILKLLLDLGSNVECVSVNEVKHVLNNGFKTEQIIFTGSGQRQSDLLRVADQGIQINVDSLNQLQWLANHGKTQKVSLRVNTDYGDGHHQHVVTGGNKSKFGIHISSLDTAKEIASSGGLIVNGLHQHIGSLILNPETFIQAMEKLYLVAHDFSDLEFIDFGGSFGVPYRPDQSELDFAKLGQMITDSYNNFTNDYGKDLRLYFEPGRYLVAESGTLLTTVADIKQFSNRTFVLVDSGMNHLIRPALYEAYHHITNLSNPTGKLQVVSVGGNICESGDMFGYDRQVAEPRLGDMLAIHTAGAYGSVMSSNYNLHDLASEVVYNAN